MGLPQPGSCSACSSVISRESTFPCCGRDLCRALHPTLCPAWMCRTRWLNSWTHLYRIMAKCVQQLDTSVQGTLDPAPAWGQEGDRLLSAQC